MSSVSAGAVKDIAAEAGYSDCGITTAEPFAEFAKALDDRIRRFPSCAALYEEMRGRADPRGGAPWAKSIVVCVRRYGKYIMPGEAAAYIGKNYLADRRHTGNPDHAIPARMKKGLRKLGMRVKQGGVPERWAGARAGVTKFGRNCFAYSRHGSWINIESWRVDADLEPDKPSLDSPCPEGCRACIDACPTGALCEPHVMRLDHCAAYVSYGHPEPVPEELLKKMGPWIYGCDACQNACPLNRGKWEEKEPMPWMNDVWPLLTPERLAEIDEETYRKTIQPRFFYVPPENIRRWHKNAGRVVGQGRGRRIIAGRMI